MDTRFKAFLILLIFFLLSLALLGLVWLRLTPSLTASLPLAYAAGLSMIILPCTLPLVFIVVPLSVGRGYWQGLLTAALFALGLTITITLYAAAIAEAGAFLGVPRVSQGLWAVAGAAAIVFAWGELKLLSLRIPTLSTTPGLIQRQAGWLKPFLFGLFLGNIGVACPNPAFWVLMLYIAGTGSLGEGVVLGAVHGAGRAVPLLLLSVLALFGVNATSVLLQKKALIEHFIGWGLLAIGSLLLTMGLFGMTWWDVALPHLMLDWLSRPLLGQRLAELPAEAHLHPPTGFEPYAPWLVVLLIGLTLLWYDYSRWRNARS